jgi:hypothetical protein
VRRGRRRGRDTAPVDRGGFRRRSTVTHPDGNEQLCDADRNVESEPSMSLFIAEAGVNYNGDLDLAERLVDARRPTRAPVRPPGGACRC